MSKSRILDSTDFTRTFSVFLMMFLFIAIICFLAAMIISYTRCITISLNNRYVFEDLKRLGASPLFSAGKSERRRDRYFRFLPSSA